MSSEVSEPAGTLAARVRTMIVLALVLDAPIAARAVRWLTREPRVESLAIDGVPAQLMRPARKGPWPAFVFVTGAHPLRRREPVVLRLGQGLARAGYLVVIPDLPGLGEGEIMHTTLDSAARVVDWTTRRADVRGGRVALCGASVGASLALLVAGRPELAHRITVIASISPFADLEKMICLATTGCYEELEPQQVTTLLRRVVARSLLHSLPPGDERDRLLECVGDITSDDRDPLEPLRQVDATGLRPAANGIVQLLSNADPARFRGLYDGLPAEVHSLVARLSPLRGASGVQAPVELAVPPLDQYFPPGEARSLVGSLPNVRLTVTATLDHTRPTLSRVRLRELARFERFVVRTLAHAAGR